jgi:hypothetical protein
MLRIPPALPGIIAVVVIDTVLVAITYISINFISAGISVARADAAH